MKKTDKPWLSEPTAFFEVIDDYELVCLRVSETSHWCGYVGLPKSHWLNGKSYSENLPELKSLWDARKEKPIGEIPSMSVMLMVLGGEEALGGGCRLDTAIDVHGGITFSGNSRWGTRWYIGFDCAHAWDFSPKFGDEPLVDQEWRDIDYVRKETRKLFDQLKALERSHAEAE